MHEPYQGESCNVAEPNEVRHPSSRQAGEKEVCFAVCQKTPNPTHVAAQQCSACSGRKSKQQETYMQNQYFMRKNLLRSKVEYSHWSDQRRSSVRCTPRSHVAGRPAASSRSISIQYFQLMTLNKQNCVASPHSTFAHLLHTGLSFSVQSLFMQ